MTQKQLAILEAHLGNAQSMSVNVLRVVHSRTPNSNWHFLGVERLSLCPPAARRLTGTVTNDLL